MTVREGGRKTLNNDNKTDVWKEYERGKSYIDKLNLVKKAEESFRFYEGDHWKGLKTGGENMPIVEILRPVVDYKVAVVTQHLMQIWFSAGAEQEGQREAAEICDLLNTHIARVWEHRGMDNFNTDVVREACICGEKYVYAYFEPSGKIENGRDVPGEIAFESVDGVNVMFGDEQERDLQKQPYILLVFRRRVEDVIEEAKKNKISAAEIRKIVADDDKELQTGAFAKEEIESKKGKCLCILKLYKKDGKVYMRKCTRTAEYVKETELPFASYPLAKLVWTGKKGTCRGEGEVYKYIPNQIWVNKLEAYRLISAKLFAFPKMVYSSRIVNKDDVSAVGVALEVDEDGVRAAMDAVAYLNPAPMSGDAAAVLSELMTYTKEAAGASDVALGNTKPDNYRAILAVQQANAAPLSSQVEAYKAYLEQVARIFYDFWCGYYQDGITVETERENIQDGVQNGKEHISQEELKNMKVRIRVDITPATPFDKLVEQQKADNLLTAKLVTLDEYAELLPADEPMKQKLVDIVEKRMAGLQQQMQALQEENNQMAGMLDTAAQDALAGREQATQMAQQAYERGAVENAARE
jgi:hypothetical protein